MFLAKQLKSVMRIVYMVLYGELPSLINEKGCFLFGSHLMQVALFIKKEYSPIRA